MILQISNKYAKPIASFFFLLIYSSFVLPLAGKGEKIYFYHSSTSAHEKSRQANVRGIQLPVNLESSAEDVQTRNIPQLRQTAVVKEFIGGPTQPEMSSFKSIGADNLVSLFTGDFSYNIPLMDVGGYPVNIYYNGGITMDQEASWVGLGWNINPGNINRNTRGVPDDFNGTEKLEQRQYMKPNRTWGLSVGPDFEMMGIKLPVKLNLGVAFNNYLGPSLDLGIRGHSSFKLAQFGSTEKYVSSNLNLGIDINSRYGTSFSGGLSFLANAEKKHSIMSGGFGISTGYNSRSGIKAIQLNEQMSFNSTALRYNVDKNWDFYSYKAGGSFNPSLFSSSITFAKPSYLPAIRMPVTNTAWSGHFQLGTGMYGATVDFETEVYGQISEIAEADKIQLKPMVGYLYSEKAISKADAVMDFTRFGDAEITPKTPVISVPQYTYDVFSIQGEGTGGTVRAYRNDLGLVRDNLTITKDKNISAGVDLGPSGHYGANFNVIKTPNRIGEWVSGNKLRSLISFKERSGQFENVYFRNPGENTVVDQDRLSQVGGTTLVRFLLGGTNSSPSIEPRLQLFNNSGQAQNSFVNISSKPTITARNKRTQIVNFLKAEEASRIGLDKYIKNYNNSIFLDANSDTLLFESLPRYTSSGYRKAHHISQIDVTESNGRRYVYGIPVYNVTQKDFTFSVDNEYIEIPDLVAVDAAEMSLNSPLNNSSSSRDGYTQITTTPSYAHSFLLTGLLSPDYVDVSGDGITEDDLGTAVKFNYSMMKNGQGDVHNWRTPFTGGNDANFNAGTFSEKKDDKGLVSFGSRENWYLSSIESKSMIALFYVSDRLDGVGVINEFGGRNVNENMIKKLDSIVLYNKADLKKNKLIKARPIKKVVFEYSYALCKNTPDNKSSIDSLKGKLTLEKVYFTYNGSKRNIKNPYRFYYSSGANDSTYNPKYAVASSDRWGNYKPSWMNPSGLKNRDYPYVNQENSQRSKVDSNASAWMLRKIVLPSGGQIEVDYEADDYAFVQNKRAADMMQVVGFGNSSNFNAASDRLYNINDPVVSDNDYVFIKVPKACNSKEAVKSLYLEGIEQLAFKLWVKMPKSAESLLCYATINDYGYDTNDSFRIWIKMNRLNGQSPLAVTALEYLRQHLPGQAFPGYDVKEETDMKKIGVMLGGMINGLKNAFTDPVTSFRNDGKAMRTDLSRCFVRLNDPDGFKVGGGYRVKSVLIRDNWDSLTNQFASTYGQIYKYTLQEVGKGQSRIISSGVASYEPSIGGEENPFQTILQFSDHLPAGPTSYGSVEMPVLDAFFPAAMVGYSKVTVQSYQRGTPLNSVSRSGVGKQVTEFYTAKDFPVQYSYTPFDSKSVKEFHQSSTMAFFEKWSYDYKAHSQGFLVVNNDMHGKMKAQSSYGEKDSMTRISYTENFYRNTSANNSNDLFAFIDNESGGAVSQGNMGVDVELMTDTREFSVRATSSEVQGQVEIFPGSLIPFLPFVWVVSGITENIYRAVTTTKVVNYHAVLDSVVVIDKGSVVTTRNLAYDAQTGQVVLTRTNNEFDQQIYNTTYPAYWAYSGMSPAYKNIDATYKNISFLDGAIVGSFDLSIFESGDEILVYDKNATPVGCEQDITYGSQDLIWAFDRNRNTNSLYGTANLIFIDAKGRPFSRSNVDIRIVRSGKRNMLDATAATVTSLVSPISTGKLVLNASSKVINASAIDFREKWQTDNDVIKRVKLVTNPVTCVLEEVEDSTGYMEKSINPYRKGLLGNFRPYRSLVFYGNRKEADVNPETNISAFGLIDNFKLYWDFNLQNKLMPDSLSTKWVWNSRMLRLNAKGLETETQDALGIYTSAQYGYNKTQAVAIANNAASQEMFAESFEDYDYAESISGARFNFSKRHVDFRKATNVTIVNTDGANFKAHTGKHVMAVNGTAVLSVPIQQATEGFNAIMTPSNKQTVVYGPLGGNMGQIYSTTNLSFNNSYTTFNTGNSMGGVFYTIQPYIPYNASPAPPQSSVAYYYMINTKQYFEVKNTGTITLNFKSTNYYYPGGTGSNFPQYSSINVFDSANNIIHAGTDLPPVTESNGYVKRKTFCLNKGVYILNLQFYVQRNYTCTPSPTSGSCLLDGVNNQNLMIDNYSIYDSNTPSLTGLQFFRNYTTVTGCAYTKPIAADSTMIHPIFSPIKGKSMVFSAWVKENCGNAQAGIPCREYTYTKNQINIKFRNQTNSVTLTPSGPIVEGWQRYEGVFDVPVNADILDISFINTSGQPLYLDDIRVHPFNSNMKSYVYDPVNLRLVAELDANNYARFYEYDEEGTLIRTKVETRDGVKTINETRSALQKIINKQ